MSLRLLIAAPAAQLSPRQDRLFPPVSCRPAIDGNTAVWDSSRIDGKVVVWDSLFAVLIVGPLLSGVLHQTCRRNSRFRQRGCRVPDQGKRGFVIAPQLRWNTAPRIDYRMYAAPSAIGRMFVWRTVVNISCRERIGRRLDELDGDLRPFLERELESHFGVGWRERVRPDDAPPLQDVATTLKTMDASWSDLFQNSGRLTRMERALVNELREWRNRWARGEFFSEADVARVNDNVERLLKAIARSPWAGGDHSRAEPKVASDLESPSPAVGAGDKKVWYKCLVCGGVSAVPNEPWCIYLLPMMQPHGVSCGFTTQRWQAIDEKESAALKSAFSIHDELRMNQFYAMGGGYAFGCLAILLAVPLTLFFIWPLCSYLYTALASFF
jgi:hypothetical protein